VMVPAWCPADDWASFLKVTDAVGARFDPAHFNARLDQYRKASERRIETDPMRVVKATARRLTLTEGEKSSGLHHLVVRHTWFGGPLWPTEGSGTGSASRACGPALGGRSLPPDGASARSGIGKPLTPFGLCTGQTFGKGNTEPGGEHPRRERRTPGDTRRSRSPPHPRAAGCGRL
jgi:hypothetical protein